MDQKLFNLINDEHVQFFLVATPRLKELIVSNEHPVIQKLASAVKAELLAERAYVIDREDVAAFLDGTMDEDSRFLLETGEVRVVGEPSYKVNDISEGQ